MDPVTPRPMSRPSRRRAGASRQPDAPRPVRRRPPRRGGSPGPSGSGRGRWRRRPRAPSAHGARREPPVRTARTAPGATPSASASSVRTRASSPLDERLVAEDGAGLDGRDGVAADRAFRGAQLDAWQLGRPRRERLEPELEPRRDRPADVGAVRGDAVERRRGPEVDDDRRRPVEPLAASAFTSRSAPTSAGRSTRIAIGTVPAGGQERAAAQARGDDLGRGGHARDDGRRDEHDRVDRASDARRAASSASSATSSSSAVARGCGRGAPGRHQRPARNRPTVTFVLPMSSASSMAR